MCHPLVLIVPSVSARLQVNESIRAEVLASLDPATLLAALRRVLPFPASAHYTAVVLMPRPPLWRRLLSPAALEGRVRPPSSPKDGYPHRLLHAVLWKGRSVS